MPITPDREGLLEFTTRLVALCNQLQEVADAQRNELDDRMFAAMASEDEAVKGTVLALQEESLKLTSLFTLCTIMIQEAVQHGIPLQPNKYDQYIADLRAPKV